MQPTENLNKRFCKDLNLPIKIFKEPYFSQRINLYDIHYSCKSKYEDYCILLKNYNNEEEYFNEYNSFKENVIKYISEQEDFKKFNNEDMNNFNHNFKFSHNSIYKVTNNNRYFISVDLCKGNFTALKHYSEEIFDGAETYEEFVTRFTSNKHFIESKYIRQVIFGTLNPKRQVKYEEFLLSKVWEELSLIFDDEQVVFFSTDEIVLSIDKDDATDKLKNYFKELTNNLKKVKINVKIEFFSLLYEEEFDSYIKNVFFSYTTHNGEENTPKKVIKNATSLTLPYLLRNLYNLPSNELDDYFIYEGKLAKFINT